MLFRLMNESIERFVKERFRDLCVYFGDGLYMNQIISRNHKERLFCEWMIFEWDPSRMFICDDWEG